MTAEMKAKWLEALRSGRYKQGSGFLRRGDEYCCLGVLCDLDGAKWTTRDDFDRPRYLTEENEVHVILPNRLAKLRLNSAIAGDVAGRNDRGYSFAEIADWIEEKVPVSA